jgi:outer membrane protein assembly factor BamE (lipoprotein component of BamABCDE complex)
MNRTRKAISVVLALLIGIPVLELAREEFVYLGATKTLKNAYSRVEPGMIRGEVEQLAGTPDSTKDRNSEEIWYWDAAEHQGKLWKFFGLSWRKGHETLAVEFDDEGRVTRKWGGTN